MGDSGDTRVPIVEYYYGSVYPISQSTWNNDHKWLLPFWRTYGLRADLPARCTINPMLDIIVTERAYIRLNLPYSTELLRFP